MALFLGLGCLLVKAGASYGHTLHVKGPRDLGSFLPVYPPFLVHEYSGWVALGRAPSEELLEAHQAFCDGFRTNNFHLAVEKFRKKLLEADHPPWAQEALWHIAEGYHRMRHFQEAAQYWSMTAKASGEKDLASAASACLAESLFQSWKLPEAYETLKSLVEVKDPRIKPWALFRLADCANELGEKARALETYRAAMAMKPEPQEMPPESLENIARLLEEKGEGKEAAKYLMLALSLHGENPRAHLWKVLLARALGQQGKMREAALLAENVAALKGSRDVPLAKIFLAKLALNCDGGRFLVPDSPKLEELKSFSSEASIHDPKARDTQRIIAELSECLSKKGDPVLAWDLLCNLRRGLSPDSLWPELRRAVWNVGVRAMGESVEKGSFLMAEEIFQDLSDLFAGLWQEPSVLLLAARTKEELGFNKVAMELYSRARSLSSSRSQMSEPALGLIRCYLKELLLDDALRVLREEGALAGKFKKRGQDLLRWVSKIGGREAGEIAAKWLDGAVKGYIDPFTVSAIATLSIEKGACGDALVLIGEDLNPLFQDKAWGDQRVWVSVADLLQCSGKNSEAIKWYARAASSEPLEESGKYAAFKLIQISMDKEAKSDLVAHLEKLLKEPPGSPWRVLAESIKAKITWKEMGQKQGGKSS